MKKEKALSLLNLFIPILSNINYDILFLEKISNHESFYFNFLYDKERIGQININNASDLEQNVWCYEIELDDEVRDFIDEN
jgi:hypothetical protein